MDNWIYSNHNKCWIFKDNVVVKGNSGIRVGEFYTDKNGDIRRHNSDGTNTKVENRGNKFYWTQPDGRRVHNTRLKTLVGQSFFDITDNGVNLITQSEGMGAPGYEGRWYKRKKDEGNKQWDGWFIGNGLSETFTPSLNEIYGDPDSNNFTIKDITVKDTQYKVAIPKNTAQTPVLTEQGLKDIIRNNTNDVFGMMRITNPELYRLITYAPTPVQEALYSLYHQYGPDYTNPDNKGKYNKSGKERYHYDTDRIITALKNKDYRQLSEIIRRYDKIYRTRRKREADYIINNMQLGDE